MEVSRPFRNGGNGQAGTVWQLSGRPPESESDNLLQTLHPAQFPPSAPDFLIRWAASGRAREGTERCGGVRGEGGPRGDRAAGQDRRPRSPTTPPPLTCAFFPGEEGPQRSAGARRAPDSAAPGGVRPGPEWRELGAAPRGRGLGYCIVAVWARSRVFYTPTRTSLCGGAHAVLSWGHPQGRTAAPSPPSGEPHRFK